MKSLELMKSIESVELAGLTGLIESNQANRKLLYVDFFRHYFSSIFIEEPTTKLSISFFSGVLSSDSQLLKKLCYFLHWNPFKNDEKCFIFHLKSSFCSQDI